MRWSVATAALGLLASGCQEPAYLGGFYADGGVDAGFPIDPSPDDPDPPPDAGIRDVDELLELAWSDEDFGGRQGENGWRYGFAPVEEVRGSGSPGGPGGDVSDPGPGGGVPSSIEVAPETFVELAVLEDTVAFEGGREWILSGAADSLYVGARSARPSGLITVGGRRRDRERWAIRRWDAPSDGTYLVYVEASAHPGQSRCAVDDGVRVSVWRQQTRLAAVDVAPLAAGATEPAELWAITDLRAGDAVDVAVEPLGNDLCDATLMRVGVYERRALD